MTMKFGGAAVIFDANGNCVEAIRRLEAFSKAFCEYQGSIYVHRVYVVIDRKPPLPGVGRVGAVVF